jgi:hypothetical protein
MLTSQQALSGSRATAVDTLLNLAGLASSTANPNSLDDRVLALVK